MNYKTYDPDEKRRSLKSEERSPFKDRLLSVICIQFQDLYDINYIVCNEPSVHY